MLKNIIINNVKTFYYINEYGEIKNEKTHNKLKGNLTREGYHYYRLSVNGKKYRYYTHRLVAEYFLNFDKNDKTKVINHLDGNKSNNFYKNLEICTHSNNINHAYKNNLIAKRTK